MNKRTTADRCFPTAGRTVDVIDSHTCGQPTRMVVAGTDVGPGTDPRVARDWLAQHADWIRRTIVLEPRGHRSMFGVVLIEPAVSGEPFGLVYMDANGYPDMCGHATIGAATSLFEQGYLTPQSTDFTGEMIVRLRVPMGDLALTVRFVEGRTQSVAFRTPLAFYLGSADIRMPDGTSCPVDIAYGGQWYAYVSAEYSGLAIAPANIDGLIAAAAPVRQALADQLTLIDPMTHSVPLVGNIVWTAPADHPSADARNVPISSAGSFDRSPCGTATCARMAVQIAKGELMVGAPFINQGLVGTLYHGRMVGQTVFNGVEGYIPEVEGSAWLTASASLWIDPRDPLGQSFLT